MLSLFCLSITRLDQVANKVLGVFEFRFVTVTYVEHYRYLPFVARLV